MIATRDYNIDDDGSGHPHLHSRIRLLPPHSNSRQPTTYADADAKPIRRSRAHVLCDLRHYRSKDTASRLPLGKRVSRRAARALQKCRMTAATAVATPSASRRLQPFTTSPWARKNIGRRCLALGVDGALVPTSLSGLPTWVIHAPRAGLIQNVVAAFSHCSSPSSLWRDTAHVAEFAQPNYAYLGLPSRARVQPQTRRHG